MESTPNTSVINLSINDSVESIFDTLKKAVTLHRDGYSLSIDFSNIRPRGDIITSTQKPSEGVVTFLKIYDTALRTIYSKTKKDSPNTAILSVDHPDILEFLSNTLNCAIKIKVTPEFTEAVENNSMYNLIDPHTKKITNKLSARSVYDLITDKTSSGNDFGIIYPDAPQQKPNNVKIDNQDSLPFNDHAQNTEEIVAPPVVNMR